MSLTGPEKCSCRRSCAAAAMFASVKMRYIAVFMYCFLQSGRAVHSFQPAMGVVVPQGVVGGNVKGEILSHCLCVWDLPCMVLF